VTTNDLQRESDYLDAGDKQASRDSGYLQYLQYLRESPSELLYFEHNA